MTYSQLAAAAALLALAAASCIVREPGTRVEVDALSHAGGTSRATLTSDQGYHVQLDELYIVLSRVELVPCPGAQRASLLREVLGPSIAYAHGTNTATAWSVPYVLAPLHDDAPVPIAVLHPPAITYCGLRVSLEAADADAERVPHAIDLNGLSMYVSGSYDLDDSGRPGVDFRYQSFVSSTMELPLVDAAGQPSVLALSEDNLEVNLRIEISYQQLFDGLALFPGAFSTFGDVLLRQALTHATAVIGERPCCR
jgi:hypothetical protein